MPDSVLWLHSGRVQTHWELRSATETASCSVSLTVFIFFPSLLTFYDNVNSEFGDVNLSLGGEKAALILNWVRLSLHMVHPSSSPVARDNDPAISKVLLCLVFDFLFSPLS